MNESKHKKKQKVAPPITYAPPSLKIWTKEQLFAMDCVASVYTKDIAGMSIPQLKDYIQNTCKSVRLNPQFVYSRHHIGDLVSHRAVNKEMKKVVMSSVPYILNNGHAVTNWGCKPDPKNLIDRMQSCLYGAPIMIDDVKYLCLLTVKFNHLTGKIFPYAINLEDENGMKVSDDIMVNNNGSTTPSNSGTSVGNVTSQDSRTPSNPNAKVQQNIETNKDNNIKEEKYTYMKKLIRLTESDLHRIVKESVQSIISEVSAAPNGFKHRFDPNKKDGDYPLEQPEWTKDPRWQGWKGEDPEWIMKQQEESGDPYYGSKTKQSVKLSESQLRQIIRESVEQVLFEGFFDKFRRTAQAKDAYKDLDGDYTYSKDNDRFYYYDKYGNKHDTGIGYGKGNVGVNWNPFKFWNSGDRQVTQNDANRAKRNLGYWDTDYKGTIDRNAKRADEKERERKEQEKWLERQRREREDYERIKREREYEKRKAKRDAEEYNSNARNWTYDGNE